MLHSGTLDQDGRMEGGVSLSHGPPVVVGQLGSASAANLYGVGGPRSTTSASTSSSSSQSPPIAPIVSSGSTAGGKMSGSTSNGGRKYQCKMCPQLTNKNVGFLFTGRDGGTGCVDYCDLLGDLLCLC
ncbi:hypothetical protein OUZ56_008929 [Daphnia magna]|uniref:Uncharacterized protein n=1 Tax=Daphnia magna TaxID=35525 RepID=A0ABR0AEH3_9CRUS|nr:hypothetical protein OUZ56_008929 [Daphnia magna]